MVVRQWTIMLNLMPRGWTNNKGRQMLLRSKRSQKYTFAKEILYPVEPGQLFFARFEHLVTRFGPQKSSAKA